MGKETKCLPPSIQGRSLQARKMNTKILEFNKNGFGDEKKKNEKLLSSAHAVT